MHYFLEKFIPLTKILHHRWLWRSRQIHLWMSHFVIFWDFLNYQVTLAIMLKYPWGKLEEETKVLTFLFHIFFSYTSSYAAHRAADLDWPGYSSGGYNLEKNHEKPTWNHEKPWKTMKKHEKTMKNHERPWKTNLNHEKPWKTTGTMKNHENNLEPWKTNLVRKCSFFITYAGSLLTFMTQNEKVLI